MALAAATWIGAAVAPAQLASRWLLPLVCVLVLAIVADKQRPFILVLPMLLLGSHLGARADAAYVPLDSAVVDTVAEVLGDPRPIRGGWRLELRLPDGARVLASAYGRDATVATRTRVGATVLVEGRVAPVADQAWLRSRHIVGTVSVSNLELYEDPPLLHQMPEVVRHRIAAGTTGMADRQRALYLGLVIGDDRLQPLGQQLRFQSAGLTHLLAVSGQNVAFAIAVARPLLELLGYRGRFVGLLGVLILFAIITRLEPSVLRATATAMLSAWATLSGRERTGLTVLSAAVVVLVCIDPFLVDSVGFQLSVAASAGILVISPGIERRLPGPSFLRSPLAVTLGAQLGVSPLLIHYFGPLSLASVPANLLAGWAAAAVMTIGLSVGVVAGLAPAAVGGFMQLPAELLLWWIETVAEWSARAPVPHPIGPGSTSAGVGCWPPSQMRYRLTTKRSATCGNPLRRMRPPGWRWRTTMTT